MAILSVTQLNRYVGFKLKEDRALQSVLVRGEITNFTNHYRSGHLYFTLRDAESCVKAVMFRSHAQRLKFLPQEGMNVIAAASAALYERDGAFQIYVTDLQPDGTGGKALALEQLKKKLTAMGVFDAASKRPLPAMPKKIGVITSDTGAALQDVKNVIGRRYPIGHLLVYPAQVQGDAAAASVCRAIAAAERDSCDVLIVGRGGGASETLEAFNTEQVVMAIYNCTVPVVSAVGHETDWTLADAAADLRAPTPSAAAELAVPDVRQMLQQVQDCSRRLENAMQQQFRQKAQELERLQDRLKLQSAGTGTAGTLPFAEAAGSGYPADLAAMSGTAGAADQPSGHAQPHEDSGAWLCTGVPRRRTGTQCRTGAVRRCAAGAAGRGRDHGKGTITER